jgi:sugar phosphate permease
METPKTVSASRWYRIIPVVFISYSFAYLDRANFGFATAGGMATDLGISPEMQSLLASLFFLGYFFFQVPGSHYAAKKSAKKLIFWSMILWGCLAVATGLTNSVTLLIIIRFMLGVVESAVMPASLILLSHWFTEKERSRANTFLILGNPVTVLWMSILSGHLVGHLGWRWMFIIEGLPAIVWAFVWRAMIDDRPVEASWLSKQDKQALEGRLQQEQADIKPVKNYWKAFKSSPVILLSLQYALWSIGVYGFVLWLPSILHAAPNIGIEETGWLSAAPYGLAIIGMIGASHFSDKTLNRKAFVWPFLLIGALAFYGSYLVGTSNFWLSFALLVVAGGAMYTPYGPFFAVITDFLPRNVSGEAMGLINSLGALGSFIGSYIVGYLNGVTGGFGASYIFMASALALSAFVTIIALQNTSKQKKATLSEMNI